MKIAIHHQKCSYSGQWIEYCKENNIQYKIVNAYDNDIMQQIEDCDAFMWHFQQYGYKDNLFGKQLLYSVAKMGKKTYPNFDSVWHFDDKVGQKYLLEAIKAPLVPAKVFYSKEEALRWIDTTSFPKVFKLRGGAGSQNVRLAKTKEDAIKFTNKAFGRGFSQFNKGSYFKDTLHKGMSKGGNKIDILKAFTRLFTSPLYARMRGKDKGYIYFQDFIPNCTHDFRLQLVGDRCWAMRRSVRENDFRASGSGKLDYDKSLFPKEMLQAAFELRKKLGMQSIAIDFIDNNGKYDIVEVCFCFGVDPEELENGYWDIDLNFHKGKINPFGWMIEDLMK